MKVANQAGDDLITYALGSCLGIVLYDPEVRVGGLLHTMLPLSKTNPNKAKDKPAMFVDTGLPELFLEVYELGARKERLQVKVAGGASLRGTETDCFQIGKRNLVMFRKLLWKNGLLLKAEDVGGHRARTMTLEISTGMVTISSNGERWEL